MHNKVLSLINDNESLCKTKLTLNIQLKDYFAQYIFVAYMYSNLVQFYLSRMTVSETHPSASSRCSDGCPSISVSNSLKRCSIRFIIKSTFLPSRDEPSDSLSTCFSSSDSSSRSSQEKRIRTSLLQVTIVRSVVDKFKSLYLLIFHSVFLYSLQFLSFISLSKACFN